MSKRPKSYHSKEEERDNASKSGKETGPPVDGPPVDGTQAGTTQTESSLSTVTVQPSDDPTGSSGDLATHIVPADNMPIHSDQNPGQSLHEKAHQEEVDREKVLREKIRRAKVRRKNAPRENAHQEEVHMEMQGGTPPTVQQPSTDTLIQNEELAATGSDTSSNNAGTSDNQSLNSEAGGNNIDCATVVESWNEIHSVAVTVIVVDHKVLDLLRKKTANSILKCKDKHDVLKKLDKHWKDEEVNIRMKAMFEIFHKLSDAVEKLKVLKIWNKMILGQKGYRWQKGCRWQKEYRWQKGYRWQKMWWRELREKRRRIQRRLMQQTRNIFKSMTNDQEDIILDAFGEAVYRLLKEIDYEMLNEDAKQMLQDRQESTKTSELADIELKKNQIFYFLVVSPKTKVVYNGIIRILIEYILECTRYSTPRFNNFLDAHHGTGWKPNLGCKDRDRRNQPDDGKKGQYALVQEMQYMRNDVVHGLAEFRDDREKEVFLEKYKKFIDGIDFQDLFPLTRPADNRKRYLLYSGATEQQKTRISEAFEGIADEYGNLLPEISRLEDEVKQLQKRYRVFSIALIVVCLSLLFCLEASMKLGFST